MQDLSAQVESAARALVQIIARDLTPGRPTSNPPQAHIPSPSVSLPLSNLPSDARVNQALKRQFPAMFTSNNGDQSRGKGKRRFVSQPTHTVPRIKTTELQIYVLSEPAASNMPKYTPNGSEELVLAHAGLGKRLVSFKDSDKHDEIFDQLENEFPKLKSLKRSWMFYKATGGSGRRKLSMILTDAEGYTMRALKSASNNGKNVLYVVPIQEALSTDPLPYDAPEFCKMPQANCVSCGQKMPLQMLALHAEECSKSESEIFEDDALPEEDVQVTDAEESLGTCPICQTAILNDLLQTHVNLCIDRISSRDDTNGGPHQTEELPGPSSAVASFGTLESYNSEEARTNSTEWMSILDPCLASALFCRNLRRQHSNEKPLHFYLDLKESPEDQDRAILSFYKAKGVNWAAPLKCILQGDAAIGDGVNRHLLSMAIEKLRTGFSLNFGIADVTLLFEGEQDHLVPCCSQTLLDSDLFVVAGRMIGHSFLHGGPLLSGISSAIIHVLMGGSIETAEIKLEDCPDFDQRHTIQLLQGNRNLSEEEKEEVTRLAVSWDLPGFSEQHRKWLFNRLLQHAVLDRTKCQVKQLRRGIKETKIWSLITAREDAIKTVFPRASEVQYGSEVILQHITWPVANSDDDDDDNDGLRPEIVTRQITFLREYIQKASFDQLQKLMSFWTGWEVPSNSLQVKVCKGTFFKASTCSRTLMLPADILTMDEFSSTLQACANTSSTGFGLV